jgi:amidase/aspartyl-tRNA(Asn)/glutamyl-tRNA(Gln) amidotransferase subunit A
MEELSEADIMELGAQFSIEVQESEAEFVTDIVNSMVGHLDKVDKIPLSKRTDSADPGARTWREPKENPHNAISRWCDVQPVAGHADLLSDPEVGVKDNITVANVPMDCASEVMRDFVPTVDATAVKRLREAGATITAKTNLDEFATSPRGVTSYHGPITTPHSDEHIAGGSSGGSAAAVAMGSVDAALGTDTGGSVRIPASFCGVIGLKPTLGLVSSTGLVEYTYTFDCIGPITANLRDAARLLASIAGEDTQDSLSLQAAGRDGYEVGDYVKAVENPPDPTDVTLGLPSHALNDEHDLSMREQTEAAIDRMEDAGVDIRPVSIDHFDLERPVKDCISVTELAAHWRAGGAPYRRVGTSDETTSTYQVPLVRRAQAASGELGVWAKSKHLAGAHLIANHLNRHYMRAQAAREVLREEYESALADVDALLTPTVPSTPPRLEDAADPTQYFEYDYAHNTRAANVTRMPAISIPNGNVDGLPVGVQLMSDAFAEETLLGTAAAIEPFLDSV